MDASTSRRNVKTKRLIKRHKKGEGEDMISCLPDNILHHILSFLPTNYAVSTGALSRRWKHLWTAVSNLDFSDKLHYSKTTHVINPTAEMKFVKFVENVLLLHDETFIQKFSLSSRMLLDASRVNAWISAILNRELSEVTLEVNLKSSLALPCTLFNCEQLTIICVESVVQLPPSICLSRLKVLHLEDIAISCDEVDAVQRVSFSCPILEKLNFTNCQLVNIKAIDIFAPVLKKLIIHEEHRQYFHCDVKIYAESLISLDLTSRLFCQISLYNASSLCKASINYNRYRVESEFGIHASKFLEGICNVKDLMLSGHFIKALSDADLTKKLLEFTHLKHINVSVYLDYFNGGYLKELLCYMPNIESLLFTYRHDSVVFEEQVWTPGTLPQGFLSHLKCVELGSFYGKKNELCFVEFLLKTARALEKITIISSSTLSKRPKKQMEVTQQLLMFPRSSVYCVIDFSYKHKISKF